MSVFPFSNQKSKTDGCITCECYHFWFVADPSHAFRRNPCGFQGVCGCERTISWGVGRLPVGAFGGLHKGRSSRHLLHMFYVALICSSHAGSVMHLTHFLNLYPNQVGLTAGENHIFWVLNRLSTIHKKEKQWALQPCLPALPLAVTLPLARLSAWPLLTCGAFNKEKAGSNFILSMRVIHVLKGDKNVIRKFSCQMCGKWNQFINAVKPTCETGIKGEVRSHPRAYCDRVCARQRALVLGKGMLLLWPHAPAANKHGKFSSAQMHF